MKKYSLLLIFIFFILFGWLGCTAVSEPAPAPTAEPVAIIAPTTTATAMPSPTAEPSTPAPTATATAAPPTATTSPMPQFRLRQQGVDGADVVNCPALATPALLFQDTEEAPPGQATYLLYPPANDALCRLTLVATPRTGQIGLANGLLYYAVYEEAAGHFVIWEDDGVGNGRPLPFTQTAVADFNNSYFRFLVAEDGARLAWSLSSYEGGEGQTSHNQMWLAEIDGRDLRQLYDRREDGGFSYVEPLRFTGDGRLLFAHQPLGLGGSWDRFVGRYQTVYQIDLAGGNPALLFACDQLLCLGDISADGRYLALTDESARRIQIVTWEGELVQTVIPPGQDYVGYPTFAADGRLFFTSADFDASYNSAPGYLSVMVPPYTEAAQLFYQADNLTVISQIMGNHLLYWQQYEMALLDLAPPHGIVQFANGRFEAALP